MFDWDGGRGHGERERPPGTRVLASPLDVWVDVPRLMRRPRGHQVRYRPGILTGYRAQGQLREWAPTADGAWLGLVTYELDTTDGLTARVTHYVPGDLIARRTPRDTRRAK